MCLFSEEKCNISDKDIVVYKIFKRYDGEIISPFMHKKYSKNRIYKETLSCAPPVYSRQKYMWERGFHSCLTLKSAKRYMKVADICTGYIYKCIIPKGSEYVIGLSSGVKDLVVSNQIIIKRRLLFNRF